MADGRMLRKKVSLSKQVTRLIAVVDERMGVPHGAYAALLFTWCIAHLDREGRMHGDPMLVKSAVFPRIDAVSVGNVESYLSVMNEIDLVCWYEAEDDRWLAFPGFERSQVGLRKDRESPSACPQPNTGVRIQACRSNAGVSPQSPPQSSASNAPHENSSPGRREEKGSEEKGKKNSACASEPEPSERSARIHSGMVQDAWLAVFGGVQPPPDGLRELTDALDAIAADPRSLAPLRVDVADLPLAVLRAYKRVRAGRDPGYEGKLTPRNVLGALGDVQLVLRGELNPEADRKAKQQRAESTKPGNGRRPDPVPSGRVVPDAAETDRMLAAQRGGPTIAAALVKRLPGG